MCVIIAKPSKVQAPDIATIRAAIATNPHGSSIVWVKDGHLETFKSLNAEEMINYYKTNVEALKNAPFVFHARIATNGSKCLKNCHGWKTLNGHAAFFHNGVLNIESRGDLTDSETFLRDIYEPIALNGGHKKAVRAINAIIGTSKFAFIGDTGEIKLYGHYFNINGVMYSNLNHVRHEQPRHYSYIDWWDEQLKLYGR
jgi:hypothetical protein